VPEGDTIWRTAVLLQTALVGKVIRAARPDALRKLTGTTVIAVESVGKHLVIRFDNDLALHSHMRMRGVWQVYRSGERWRRPDWQLKAMLETDEAVAACFGAPIVELLRNVAPRLGHLGPDILAPDWSAADVLRRARQLNQVPIGEVLLDQRVTSGIGNVYRCEALWQRQVNPWTQTIVLSDEELTGLFEVAREAMRSNLQTTFRRTFPGYGRGAVHGRGGRPCPRCGTRIRVRPMGENARLAYWCPTCQPERKTEPLSSG
jgi:endonuclease-8